MSAVTIAEAWPAAGRPRPTIHQFVVMRLLRVLADACPEDLCVVPESAVELGPQTEFAFRAALGARTGTEDPGGQRNSRFQLDAGSRRRNLTELAGLASGRLAVCQKSQ